jgi:pfkB family carbohydrate kinase
LKLLIIGHSVIDYIHFKGQDKTQPGGIFYTTAALQNYKSDGDEIYLNTSVQKDKYDLFANVYDNLNKNYIHFVEKIPKVYLFVHDFKERGETYENITQNLKVNVENVNSFDGILLNMITGFDVKPEQLKGIREKYKGIIYFDVHTLSRGLDKDMKRDFRLIPEFENWASNINIIQANEEEIKTINQQNDELSIAKEILNAGPEILIVTKGEFGARAYFKKKNEIQSVFKSSIKVNVNNKIGCGDVFGAVFFYSYIQTKNIEKSLQLAVCAGSFAVSNDKIEDYKNLKDYVLSRYN